jgi:hypothetical protein
LILYHCVPQQPAFDLPVSRRGFLQIKRSERFVAEIPHSEVWASSCVGLNVYLECLLFGTGANYGK